MEGFAEEWVWQAWLVWVFPLLGAVLTPVLAKIHPKARDYGAVFFSLLAAIMAVMMIPHLLEGQLFHNQVTWNALPGSPILAELKAGVIVDPLSVIMANVVAVISFLIMVYSLGYMHGDESLTRYWFFMNLFIGNMLLLVMSDNFIQLLFGWEGVGLCSYALIGFWYKDSKKDYLKCWVGEEPKAYPPSHCGLKAFITTRFGDILFLFGIFVILAFAGTVNFVELQNGAIGRVPIWALLPAAILLFGGPIGKSAQLPLMEWLPDAMAGPTTVSALIHAATMVKAGVYLVGRVFPIFYLATWAAGSPNDLVNFFYVVAWIGAVTAFVAGTQGMTSKEIKKVLAYSTVSQLGYMMLAMGVAGATAEFIIGYTGGVFHLMSHALFKAALFLTAGAVIHAVESRFMTDMGGLKQNMPITFWSTVLTGFSLMGVPLLFSGFWSKDMVLEAPLLAGQYWIFVIAAATVAITCFYTVRMIGITFLGSKSEHISELEKEGRHLHEAPPVMWVPFALLAGATVAFGVGGFFARGWLESVFAQYLGGVIGHGELVSAVSSATNAGMAEDAAVWVTLIVSISMLLIGAVPAYFMYIRKSIDPVAIVKSSPISRGVWKFIANRWYINSFLYTVLVYPTIGICRWLSSNIELRAIDRFNYLVASAGSKMSDIVRKTQTGVLTSNVVAMLMGLTMILLILLRVALG
jgi:NADH-quinone oxidoreductase subunit L